MDDKKFITELLKRKKYKWNTWKLGVELEFQKTDIYIIHQVKCKWLWCPTK